MKSKSGNKKSSSDKNILRPARRHIYRTKISMLFIFVAAILVGYNNCAPQLYNNSQSSSSCSTIGYTGPSLIVNGQMISADTSTSAVIHATVNHAISFSIYENGAAVTCAATNGQSYWVLPTAQQITNNCISQAIAANGQYIYTYHAVEYINGTECPPATNNVSVQISIP